MFDVCGGVYTEHCQEPMLDQVYGSAGRSAVLLSHLTDEKITLNSYASEKELQFINDIGRNIIFNRYERSGDIIFRYHHQSSRSTHQRFDTNNNDIRYKNISVAGECILAFSAIENGFDISCKTIVIDPQGESSLGNIKKLSEKSEIVHLVLNGNELRITIRDAESVDRIFTEIKNLESITVKNGPFGAYNINKNGTKTKIPCYRTKTVNKIGSGDIFSSSFYFKIASGFTPIESANFASKMTAYYSNEKSLHPPHEEILDNYLIENKISIIPTSKKKPNIYLAGPFFDIAQRWLISEAKDALQRLGVDVLSPSHDVGIGGKPESEIYREDIDLLRKSDALFVILNGYDTGTIFETGYATSMGLPCIIFCENIIANDMTMFANDKCMVFEDFTSAIYNCVWSSIEKLKAEG